MLCRKIFKCNSWKEIKMIRILSIICVISSVWSAPVDVTDLYNIVISDNRTENLRKHPFVAECKEPSNFSKSLCFAMFDVSLSFNTQKLEFTTTNVTFEEGSFCDALQQVLPDSPANNESTFAFKDSAQWFKDTLKNDNENDVCNRNCFYKDRRTYEMELLPVCRFLLNQYSLLFNQSSSTTISIQPANAIIQKPAETTMNETKPNDVKTEVDAATSEEAQAPLPPAGEPVQVIANASATSTTFTTVNSTVTKVQNATTNSLKQQNVEPVDEIVKPGNVTTPKAKPVELSSESSTKKVEVTKVETTKSAVDMKPEEQTKVDESLNVNLDGGDENNVNPFDNDGAVDEVPDKEADAKAEFPYPDDEDEEYHDDAMARNNNKVAEVKIPQEPEPTVEDEVPHKKVEYVDFQEDPDSNFFTYLCGLMFICILLYILHQNRHKILALFLEGRRGSRGRRERSRGGSKAAYSKLDCNLEEAITSKKSLSGKSMDIIY